MSLYLVSVAARDEPGALAWVTSNLARWEVNLKGFVVDPAGMQLLITDLQTLSKALDEMGYLYRVSQVQEVTLADRPGALAQLCAELSAAGIGICSAFGVAHGQTGKIYVDVTDVARAAPILQRHDQATPTQATAVAKGRFGAIGPVTR